MPSPAEFRERALTAFAGAEDYRLEAKTSNPERAAMLLKWAAQREEDGWFYLSRAEIHEDFHRRHAPKQEEAA
jgi:hypothetical protein